MTRSESLKQQWNDGRRRRTINTLKKTYANEELKSKCSERTKNFFKNEDNRRKLAEKIIARNDWQQKSQRMKKWWSKSENKEKMLKIIRSDDNKTKISMMIAIKKKGLNIYPILDKMNIPYKKRYKEAFYVFDVLLYPDSDGQILLDARRNTEEMQKSAKAKETFVNALMPRFRYVWLSEINEKKILEIL